jgi:hypothetical protein
VRSNSSSVLNGRSSSTFVSLLVFQNRLAMRASHLAEVARTYTAMITANRHSRSSPLALEHLPERPR